MITPEELRTRRRRIILGVILFLVTVYVVLFGVSILSGLIFDILEAPPPSRAEIIEMIAEDEQVSPDRIELHVIDTSTDLPRVLYSIQNVPEPAPVDGLPVAYRIFIHPRSKPWAWMIGGGHHTNYRDPEKAASFNFSSALGDTGTEINTEIFGVTAPNAAEVHITINGVTHVRDVRTTNGYLILLPDKGLNPVAISEFRILDEHGNELPAPISMS